MAAGARRWRDGRRGGSRAQAAVAEAGPGPADAVFLRELADLAGDPVLVGLGGVGAVAVQVQVRLDQPGMLSPQPAEEPLPGARAQVQHDGHDVPGAGRGDLPDRLVELGRGSRRGTAPPGP